MAAEAPVLEIGHGEDEEGRIVDDDRRGFRFGRGRCCRLFGQPVGAADCAAREDRAGCGRWVLFWRQLRRAAGARPADRGAAGCPASR